MVNTKMVYRRTVTHPSTNRDRHRATLIRANALPLSQTATVRYYHQQHASRKHSKYQTNVLPRDAIHSFTLNQTVKRIAFKISSMQLRYFHFIVKSQRKLQTVPRSFTRIPAKVVVGIKRSKRTDVLKHDLKRSARSARMQQCVGRLPSSRYVRRLLIHHTQSVSARRT